MKKPYTVFIKVAMTYIELYEQEIVAIIKKFNVTYTKDEDYTSPDATLAISLLTTESIYQAFTSQIKELGLTIEEVQE